jgi:hypothetical protein
MAVFAAREGLAAAEVSGWIASRFRESKAIKRVANPKSCFSH